MVSEQPRATTHDTLSIGKHVWTVTGVFIGALGQEDVLGLQVVGEHQDASAYGADLPELFVPEILVREAIRAGILQLHQAANLRG